MCSTFMHVSNFDTNGKTSSGSERFRWCLSAVDFKPVLTSEPTFQHNHWLSAPLGRPDPYLPNFLCWLDPSSYHRMPKQRETLKSTLFQLSDCKDEDTESHRVRVPHLLGQGANKSAEAGKRSFMHGSLKHSQTVQMPSLAKLDCSRFRKTHFASLKCMH